MEIVSKVEPRTIEVTDLDIRFPGETQQITLYPGDEEICHPDSIPRVVVLRLAEHKLTETITTTPETVIVYLDHVLWIRRTTRTITLPPDKKADAPVPAAA